MLYKILADTIMVMHFVWVLFVLVGFILTLYGFFFLYIFRSGAQRWRNFFDRWLFRAIHAGGVLFVGILVVSKQYCPLTMWENTLRAKYDPALVYEGSCIVYYVRKLLYPDINLLIIRGVTTFVTLFTILAFIIRPPAKIKRIFKWKKS